MGNSVGNESLRVALQIEGKGCRSGHNETNPDEISGRLLDRGQEHHRETGADFLYPVPQRREDDRGKGGKTIRG